MENKNNVASYVRSALEKAISQLNHPYYISHNDRLRQALNKCISFPKNNYSDSTKRGNGKPHDLETRIALTLYHQWRRDAVIDENLNTITGKEDFQKTSVREKSPQLSSVVYVISDFGLSREVSSPRQLADMICPLLEENFRNNPQWNIAPDVRSQTSGIISMISLERSQNLRLTGRLPCPYCIQWCNGEKGLWWHQQQFHGVDHSSATAVAQATTLKGAIVLYNNNVRVKTTVTAENATVSARKDCNIDDNEKNKIRVVSNESCNPIEYIRQGNIDGLKSAVHNHGYQPSLSFDAKGATPLMWAAGGGHLDITRYLIEDCNCNPCQSQKGKRSFAGRTALHWAARNGRIEVVRYLLSLTTHECNGDNSTNDPDTKIKTITRSILLEAKTQDGTTAFGWACWQRHLQVMECLYQHGCDIHVLNSYGCSPVLWCSQGTSGNGLEVLKWLRDRGCNVKLVNHNGHGVLHKAAQRGQMDIAEWLIKEEYGSLFTTSSSARTNTNYSADERNVLLALVGPDTEGYCPSDLAGMEGYEDFARWLVTVETQVCRTLDCVPPYEIPTGYALDCTSYNVNTSPSFVWEQYGGLRRIRSALCKKVKTT